jgi:hypothetical protein
MKLPNWNAWHSQQYPWRAWSTWHVSSFVIIASDGFANRDQLVGKEMKWRCVRNFGHDNIARSQCVFNAIDVSASYVS